MDNLESLFLELSSQLTGVAVSSFNRDERRPAKIGDLDPRNSPVRLGASYLREIQAWKDGGPADRLLSRFQEIKRTDTADRHVPDLLSDPEFGPLCRSIIKLWMLGAWYPPDMPSRPSHVVSMHSFADALIWKLAQAHAPGYSTGSFGHWSEKPPVLEEFITLIK